MTQPVRINRYLALSGLCSRREADRLVAAGRVMIGGRAAAAGDRVAEGMAVTVDGRVVRPREETCVFAYYKPRGVVCTERDIHAERTIASELSGRLPERLLYIGRLDKDSEGLLLLTNDSALKRALESAQNAKEKEYAVTTDQPLSGEARRRMERGVFLEELGITTKPCRIFPARTGKADPRGDAGAGGTGGKKEAAPPSGERSFRIVLTEGKNRQIRRMCAAEGLKVERLVRVRECSVTLGDMQPGELRELTESEKERLYREAGINCGEDEEGIYIH